MTHQEFLSRKDFYIGKKIIFDGGKSIVSDIKLNGNFLEIYFDDGENSIGGIPEVCSIREYDDYTSVSVMYCGDCEIKH